MIESGPNPFDPPRGVISARSEQARRYGTIALGSLVALGPKLFVGFGLGFNPGWANGWPGGLAITEVWPAGMTAILITGTIGLGALLGLLLSRLATARPYAGIVFLAWLMAGAILAILACISFYQSIHAEALEAWPNGYNP